MIAKILALRAEGLRYKEIDIWLNLESGTPNCAYRIMKAYRQSK